MPSFFLIKTYFLLELINEKATRPKLAPIKTPITIPNTITVSLLIFLTRKSFLYVIIRKFLRLCYT